MARWTTPVPAPCPVPAPVCGRSRPALLAAAAPPGYEAHEAQRLHDEAERRARENKELGAEHPMTRSVTAWRPIDADIEPPVT
ncbi:MAG: hypothetical protein JF597_07840 [Streptomyces sp.]|uniref:hypothetical protein n=1 Tax=Streptomyces sp. TaxID=1931 RepID=UPI0025D82F9A|nr:hypothetical protein [Streptomyces sp.]MBW8793490.1 hypothetical protein [Streptomyces sp.]